MHSVRRMRVVAEGRNVDESGQAIHRDRLRLGVSSFENEPTHTSFLRRALEFGEDGSRDASTPSARDVTWRTPRVVGRDRRYRYWPVFATVSIDRPGS
jgi:hypothetical protein